MNGVADAIARLGGLTETARRMGVSPPAVFKWKVLAVVPPGRVPLLSELSGVPYHRLNPKFPVMIEASAPNSCPIP